MGMDPSGVLSMQFVFSTQFDAHPGGGGNWLSSILPVGHHPPSIHGPSYIPGVPDPNTFVGSQLHQMHLKHRPDSMVPITRDARLTGDAYQQQPLYSNDLRARRSIGA